MAPPRHGFVCLLVVTTGAGVSVGDGQSQSGVPYRTHSQAELSAHPQRQSQEVASVVVGTEGSIHSLPESDRAPGAPDVALDVIEHGASLAVPMPHREPSNTPQLVRSESGRAPGLSVEVQDEEDLGDVAQTAGGLTGGAAGGHAGALYAGALLPRPREDRRVPVGRLDPAGCLDPVGRLDPAGLRAARAQGVPLAREERLLQSRRRSIACGPSGLHGTSARSLAAVAHNGG
eukprot:CAMPEP_0179080080 /NCGR_PEP_ID=MMETSP0796-20121207/35969_1 /TAXON_ID=73915 /ORGANISM="Pyrodinium bahamense, Strain pbaha01" /LENGTH=231 /DNA_ID=CAMNT_0020777427 /DNA_START=23 /DNA_END=716 /DNA_ORIENTATION=-